MKKKALLVYPEIPGTYWSFKYSLPFTFKRSGFPPIGLLTVAAMLPADEFDVRLIDMNVTRLREKDIEECDIVLTSSMIIQKESLLKVIEMCKKKNKPVVAGGPYPTSCHKEIRGVDHFILNEAEVTLPLFLEDFRKGTAKPVYTSDEKPDVTKTPIPRFELADLEAYQSMSLQYSRGCPFNCEFCDIVQLFGRVPRVKTPEQFISEMDALYGLGYRGSLFIVDDNFIGNKFEVKKLLAEIVRWQKERRHPFSLFTEASINLAEDEELMDLMVAAGFIMVFVGIESPVKASLQETNKSQNLKADPIDSVNRIIRKGIEVSAGFIIGFDSDPDDIAELQIEFIQRSGIPMAMVGLLTALPNTRLHRRLEKEGRLLAESSGNNTFELGMNFIPRMPHDRLVDSYKKVVERIYDPANYFKRSSDFLNISPNKFPYSAGTAKIGHILTYAYAFIRSLILQTFSSYGVHFLRFLARTLVRTPKQFVRAVKLAVLGYHFIRLTRESITDKVKKIDSFGTLLERINARIAERIARIQRTKLRNLYGEIYSFRKKTMSSLQDNFADIISISNEKVRILQRTVERSIRSYADLLAVQLMKLSDAKELKKVNRKIEKMKDYQSSISRERKAGTIREFSIGTLQSIEEMIRILVLNSEKILKRKLVPVRT